MYVTGLKNTSLKNEWSYIYDLNRTPVNRVLRPKVDMDRRDRSLITKLEGFSAESVGGVALCTICSTLAGSKQLQTHMSNRSSFLPKDGWHHQEFDFYCDPKCLSRGSMLAQRERQIDNIMVRNGVELDTAF